MNDIVERLDTVRESLEAGCEDWPIASQIWEYATAASEIKNLRQQLAESHAEVITLRQQKDAMWFAAAESQAREVKLRGWVEKWCKFDSLNMDLQEWFRFSAEYKALPSDTTALREMLDRHVAEKNAKIERLNKNLLWSMQCTAESEAREQQLREALDAVQQVANRSEGIAGWHMNGDIASWDSILPEVEQALALPTNNTTLREMIAKAGEVMRERCAKFVKQNIYSNQTDIEAIRALPGMTLENLQ